MSKKFPVLILCLSALGRFCLADGMSAEEVSSALPRSYAGTYLWVASNDRWNATVAFSSVKVLPDGNVEATGTEHFVSIGDSDKTYDSGIRATINPQTSSFAMEEIYLGDKAGFVPMVYKGKISTDLKSIDTRWTGLKGEKVSLTLQADEPKKD